MGEISEVIYDVSVGIYDFEGDIEDIIKNLIRIKEKVNETKKYKRIELDISHYDNEIDISVVGYRDETEEEIKNNIILEKQTVEKRIEYLTKELNKLKNINELKGDIE